MKICKQIKNVAHAFLATLLLLLAGSFESANATIMLDNTITGTITNDFEASFGIQDDILIETGASYGERFDGQNLSFKNPPIVPPPNTPVLGQHDALTGTPSGPLTVLSGGADLNLNILPSVSNILVGCGPFMGTCLEADAIGEGAVSILLDENTDVFGFDMLGANPGLGENSGPATVQFFARNGSSIGLFDVTTANDFFGFKVTDGDLIAGVSLTNLDAGGVAYDNFTFNSIPATVHSSGQRPIVSHLSTSVP